MSGLYGGSDHAEDSVEESSDSAEIEAISASCPKWRVQLVNLDGAPMNGQQYSIKHGAVTGMLDDNGLSGIVDESIDETQAKNGQSGYVLFPNLRILPDFGTLWNSYPDGQPLNVVNTIGGNVQQLFGPALQELDNNSEFSNTCVVRASDAFNHVGINFIPFVGTRDLETANSNTGRGFGIPRGDLPINLYRVAGSKSWPDGRPYAYGTRVSEFAPYMNHYYSDAPIVDGTNSSSPFRDKKGVIYFEVSGWLDATGHFDVWNGLISGNLVLDGASEKGPQIRYTGYFKKSVTITLWQHITIKLKEIRSDNGVCTAIYQFMAE